MNNNNVFYQLREQDNKVLNKDLLNGNFNVNFKKSLVLNDGDELVINKAIIDTRTLEADKIIIVNDINIKFNLSYYLLNDSILTNSGKSHSNGSGAWTTADIDYELYVLGLPAGGGTPVEIYELTQVIFNNPDVSFGSRTPFNAQFSYTDVNNIPRTVLVSMTLAQDDKDNVFWASLDSGTIATSLEPVFINSTDPKVLYHNGITGNSGTLNQTIKHDTEQTSTFAPFINTIDITIKKGNYNYSDFADRVNEQLTFINNNETLTSLNPGGDNNLLLNSLHPLYVDLITKNPVFIRSTDGLKGFTIENSAPNAAVYFGTNQFSLLYDDITNRYYFKYLNMPIYEGVSGSQAVKFETFPLGTIGLKLTNKSSGILIDSITTIDSVTGLSIDLFNQILGFDMALLRPNYIPVANTVLLANGIKNRSFKCALNDGVNTTGGLSTLDILIRKISPSVTPPATPAQNLYKIVPDLPDLGYILVDQQNEIYASNAVGFGTILNFGYYIIAIDGLQADYITKNDIKNNIFAVISRYYSSNNYTVGSPEDAIIYTHRGKPQILNNLNVRILNGDFRFIVNLGPDNTLFIQHRKARVPLDMIQQLEQQQGSFQKERKTDEKKK